MKLVIGLGNPGPKYENTRHNIGFLCLDHLIQEWKASGPELKNQAQIWKCTVLDEPVLLVKPQTYMNHSGRAVAPIFQFFKCAPQELIVLHDELDLVPLEIRFKTGGGNGGHNGLRSIDECLGAGQLHYHRVRLGIGHPRTLHPQFEVADYVLGKIPTDQWRELPFFFEKARKGIELIFQGKMLEAMNRYHGKPKP